MTQLRHYPDCRHRQGFTLIEIMAAIVIIAILAVITLSIGSALIERTERRRTEDMLNLLDAAVVEYENSISRRLTYGHSGWPLGNPANGVDWDSTQFDAWDASSYDLEYSTGGLMLGFPDPLAPEFPDGTIAEAGAAGYRAKLGGLEPYQMWRKLADRLMAVESCRSILSAVDSGLIEALGTTPVSSVVPSVFQDAWGSPILVVFPGRDVYTDLDGEPATGGTLRDEDGTIRTKAERILGPARNKRVYFISAGPDRRFGDLLYEVQAGQVWNPDRTQVEMRRTDDNLYSYEVRTW